MPPRADGDQDKEEYAAGSREWVVSDGPRDDEDRDKRQHADQSRATTAPAGSRGLRSAARRLPTKVRPSEALQVHVTS